MEIRKEGGLRGAGAPDEARLAKINAYARTPLTAEAVYCFRVRLCDDRPDRDFERFDTAALPRMAELFCGKTGICDHQWSADRQVARIFDTQVVREDDGASCLMAEAYVLRTERNADLIADIDPMLNQIRKLTPYLQADGVLATTAEGKVDVFEYLQNPEQLAKYELLSNCIACGVCEGACPVYAGGDAFIGPAALIWASRFVNDSRDTKAMERMDAIDTADGVAACQSVRACSRHCPRGIDVGEEMWQIVAKVRER